MRILAYLLVLAFAAIGAYASVLQLMRSRQKDSFEESVLRRIDERCRYYESGDWVALAKMRSHDVLCHRTNGQDANYADLRDVDRAFLTNFEVRTCSSKVLMAEQMRSSILVDVKMELRVVERRSRKKKLVVLTSAEVWSPEGGEPKLLRASEVTHQLQGLSSQ